MSRQSHIMGILRHKCRVLISMLLLILASCVAIEERTTAEPALSQTETCTAKCIALTFDDAPRGAGPLFTGPERTAAFLAALDASQSGPVAMFVTTQGVETIQGFARIASYANAGHLIANHSHTHQWASRVSVEEYLADIDRAEELLKPFANRRAWYRFPFLDEGRPLEKRELLREGLSARGLTNGYVTIDTYDWYIEQKWAEAVRDQRPVDMTALRDVYIAMILDSAEFYEAAGVELLGRSPMHTLLLHENDLSASFIDDAIKVLREEGWQIIHPDTAFSDPIAAAVPQTLFGNQGRIAALAVDEGKSARTFNHWGVDEGALEETFAARGVFGAAPQQ